MQARQAKLIEALDRVEHFLDKNPAVLEGVITSTAHQNFTASRDRMEEHMSAQNAHARGIRSTVAAKKSLRFKLIQKHMRPISIIARAQLPNVGEFAALTLPPHRQHFVGLVAAAFGMARAAKLHEATFVAAGLPADFIEQLLAATEGLKAGITDRGETSALRSGATVGLKQEARVARTNLRLLDTLIRAAVQDQALLAQWRSIRRVVVAATSPRSLNEVSGSTGNTSPTGNTPTPAGPSGTTAPVTEAPLALV